ncbi:hypothetical protein C2G38_2045391 [Gigaspora rosea]|uniref:Uncharacterized protein n=1 Tax=Gigaspora rosea TaxID=44941 RepID=A0A397UGH5_9GLOM|nr:hypothetical protein C2G38_2045391 [Gigaspora rosea]
MTLIGGKFGDCGRSSLEVWGLRLLGPKPLLPNRFELIRTWKKQRIRFYKNEEAINKQKTGREVQFGEPSVRRSPRPMKCVNYAEDNSDEERKMRRVNSTAHSQSTESPQSRTPPQAPWDLSPLKTTPNKQPQNKEEI